MHMFLVKMAAGGSGSSSGTYATTTTTDGDCTDLSSDSDISDAPTDSGTGTSDPKVVSLLSKLKAPSKSDLSRKRKVQHPPKGKKRSSGHYSFNEPKVNPSQRVKEFPGEHLVLSFGKLWKASLQCLQRNSILKT